MMNHGYLICEETDSTFRVHRLIPDNKSELWDELFTSFEDAAAFVKKQIKWQEPTIQQHQDSSTHWNMEMMYRHKGLGARYANLGELGNTSYDAAVLEAKSRADSYIVQSGLEKEVEGFEVRVRPCRR